MRKRTRKRRRRRRRRREEVMKRKSSWVSWRGRRGHEVVEYEA